MTQRGRVVVAMSGGVDSSVAAGLLMGMGYDVVGVTLRMFQSEGPPMDPSLDSENQAKRVAAVLGIPHHIVDCKRGFRRLVLQPAWQEYCNGRTPSPCVLCNPTLKLGTLLDKARELGSEKIATGHYAKLLRDSKNSDIKLLRGADRFKDQSYFLSMLTREQKEALLLPLGDKPKSQVRKLAKEMGFQNAEQKESQDACFAQGDEDFAEALAALFGNPPPPGKIVDACGQILGDHPGIHHYTVGQRKKIGVALGRRAYVTYVDQARHQVVVSHDPLDLESQIVYASRLVWQAREKPREPFRCQAQIRYRHRAAPALAEIRTDGGVKVHFDEPVRAVTPGQALVLYDEDQVLGGAWIDGGSKV